MSGALTGNQHFVQVNANLAACGQEQVDVPPAVPVIAETSAQNLTITLAGGVAKLSLSCPAPLAATTMLYGAAPQKKGVNREPEQLMLGVPGAIVQGSCDVTALYTAKFGAPAIGQKVFLSVGTISAGHKGAFKHFVGIVPAA